MRSPSALRIADHGVAKLEASHRVGGERSLPFERVLANGFERFLFRQILDVLRFLNRGCAGGDRVEEPFHFRLAVLSFQHLHSQQHGRHGWVWRCGDFGGR